MVKSRSSAAKSAPLDLLEFEILEHIGGCASKSDLAAALEIDVDEVSAAIEKLTAFYGRQQLQLGRTVETDPQLQEMKVHAKRSVDRIRACLVRLA